MTGAGTFPGSAPLPGTGALAVRRSHLVDTPQLSGVVLEVDATSNQAALAVLQAGLHEYPPGQHLIHGYEVVPSGLAAWVGDRKVRLRVWLAILHDDDTITEDDPSDPNTDVLVIDLDPVVDGDALSTIAATGRVIIASPDAGPVPLVLDVDRATVADVVERVTASLD